MEMNGMPLISLFSLCFLCSLCHKYIDNLILECHNFMATAPFQLMINHIFDNCIATFIFLFLDQYHRITDFVSKFSICIVVARHFN